MFALLRESAEGSDTVLILANTDTAREQTLMLNETAVRASRLSNALEAPTDLLSEIGPDCEATPEGKLIFTVASAAVHCLAGSPKPRGLHGEDYRRARAQAAWALTALSKVMSAESVGHFDWRGVAALVNDSPAEWLARASRGKLHESAASYAPVVTWRLADRSRVLLVPPGHWLLIEDTVPFRATLTRGQRIEHAESIVVKKGHIACFAPCGFSGDATLELERLVEGDFGISATVRYLAPDPQSLPSSASPRPSSLILLTNGRGGMARMCVDLGRITSKYDCVLGANLHASLPMDRHVFVKRLRLWCNAGGFIAPLNGDNLVAFEAGPTARWHFVANAGYGRAVGVELSAEMLDERNTVIFRLTRTKVPDGLGRELPAGADVRITARFDIEDRNFHWETRRNGGAEHHFASNCRPLIRQRTRENAGVFTAGTASGPRAAAATEAVGFEFTPALDRQLRIWADDPHFHAQPEWCENIPHPVEASRGMTASGDAWSPGWFELLLHAGRTVMLVATAEPDEPFGPPRFQLEAEDSRAVTTTAEAFERQLIHAARAFVVRRGEGRTVIAGYPWFLDWGRDTLIAARGLLAAGFTNEVSEILLTFARFEENGTLPNALYGDNASNRDTVDAPLWFALACEEFAKRDSGFYAAVVDTPRRTVADVLRSIAANYLRGAPNGIRVDAASALVWSPSHFTWMDTNFPAGTPREGYAVEIQALWIRLLRQLERLGAKPEGKPWGEFAAHAERSLNELFWLDEQGWFADVLIAKPGVSAKSAVRDTALRSNMLFTASLGLVTGERARRCVDAALHHLVVPGALRSLAPLTVSPPLEIRAAEGRLLNNPNRPYWGSYEGDEDTRRKPAYHNGTAWCWTFPAFCEALARAYDFSPEATAAARAYLGSVDRLLAEGCLGHLPEICDGDAPHTQRGCDAQAWSVTEALRVWKLLSK
ncbi:MAG: glycogen debranching enzyme N-terminal domain-containing protein [Verrucomicrobia bacterium]|nr:glycogen debranching enzyme N-terminal domain-containing protein [Verrucomicrobiota bacterium]